MFKKIPLLFFLCFPFFIYSQQTNPGINPLDEKYTPPYNPKNSPQAPAPSSFSRNIVKFNPFLLTRSIAAVHYETKLYENLFVQGGLGITYNKDYIQSVFGAAFADDRYNSLGVITNNGEKGNKGSYISLELRLYFDNDAPNGGYVSAAYRGYNYHMIINPVNSYNINTNFLSRADFKIKNNALSFNFGYQLVTEGKVASTHDFFMGMGFRKLVYNAIEEVQLNSNSQYGYSSSYYRKSATTIEDMGFLILVGYSFGIGF